jgi:DNA polymerase delta subunit 4
VKAPAEPDLDEPTTVEVSIIDQAQTEAAASLTSEEEEALGVSESRIEKYWREKEAERKAPRMHQEDVPLYEKVCREWDTDGRFGVGHP